MSKDRFFPAPPVQPPSDFDQLRVWETNVKAALQAETLNSLAWMLFRPPPGADRAMIRLSTTFPQVIATLRSTLDECNRAFDAFKSDTDDTGKLEQLGDWLMVLMQRIRWGVEAMEPASPTAPKVTARKAEGADVEAVKRLAKQFDTDAGTFEAGTIGPAELAAAVGYVVGYPQFLEMVGHDWRRDDARTAAYYGLNHANTAAVHVLMREAERLGLDSGPLWEFGRVCRELFADEPWRYYVGNHDTWPDCLGAARTQLPPDYRDAIREGETALMRLNAKAGIEPTAPASTSPHNAETAMPSVQATDEIGRALRERAEIQARRTPGRPVSYDELVAIEKTQEDWELRWLHHGRWDLATLYFQIEKRMRELGDFIKGEREAGRPDTPSAALLSELRDVAEYADGLAVALRPPVPDTDVTMQQAYAWLDRLQLILREQSEKVANGSFPRLTVTETMGLRAEATRQAARNLFATMEAEENAFPPAPTPATLADQLTRLASDWRAGVETRREFDLRAANCIKRAHEAGAFGFDAWRGLAIELHGVSMLSDVLGRAQAWFARERGMPLEKMTPDALDRLAAAFRVNSAPSSSPSSSSEPTLSDKQQDILRAMFEMQAFTSDARKTTAEVATKVEGRGANADSYKQPMAGLTKAKLIDRKRGAGGGCWLTPEGRIRGEALCRKV